MSSIILMGIKHCGKSTQGKILSEKLNLPFYDTDDLITENTGKTPRQIYDEGGQEGFIIQEALVCEKLVESLKKSGESAVIATGGGICNNPKAIEALHSIGNFVFLNSQEKTACDRIVREIKKDENGNLFNLPSYIAKKNPRSEEDVRNIFHDFFTERVKIYSELADVTVQMTQESKSVNADKILCAI